MKVRTSGRCSIKALSRVLSIGVLLAVAACSSGNDRSTSTPPASVPVTANVTTGAMSEIVSLSEALEQRKFADVRKCMADEGFPQLMRAHELTAQRSPQGRSEPLRIDPLEMGPYTAEQARGYGMVGTVTLFAKSEPGMVISKDPAFDAARKSCEQRFDKRAANDVTELLKQSSDLQNDIRSGFLESTSDPIRKLVERRLECVRSLGYPQLDPKSAIESDNFSTMLQQIGIPSPDLVAPTPPEPKIERGQVVVVPPAPLASHRPQPDEVKFALAYVSCGEKLKFVEELEALQVGPRKTLTDRYGVQLAALSTGLKASVRKSA